MNFRSYFIPPSPRSYADLVYLYYLLLLPLVLAVTAVSVVLGNIELPISYYCEFGGYATLSFLILFSVFLLCKRWIHAHHVRYQIPDETTKLNSMRFGLNIVGFICWIPRLFVLSEPGNQEMVYMLDLIVLEVLALVWVLFLQPFRQNFHLKYDSEDTWRIMMVSGMNIALFHILIFVAFQRADIEERNTIVLQQLLSFGICLLTQIELMQLKNGKFERNQTCEHRNYQRLMTLSEKIVAMEPPAYQETDLEFGLQEDKEPCQEKLDQLASKILHPSDVIANKYLL